MRTQTSTKSFISIFDRWVDRTGYAWLAISCGLIGVLIVLLVIAEILDGIFARPFDLNLWRINVLGLVIIGYILLMQPLFRRFRGEAIEAIHALTTASSDDVARIVRTGERGLVLRESLAFGLGAVIGIGLLRPWNMPDTYAATRSFRVLATAIMFGLGSSVIASTLVSARVLTKLHHLPLNIDIWDTSPLDPIARRSLFLALVFVSAVIIGLLFIPNQTVSGLLADAAVILAAIAIFFISMLDTHTVMREAKLREVKLVHARLAATYQMVIEHTITSGDSDVGSLSTATNLLLAYEKRINETPEWPFNNSILRRLVASALVPIGLIILQRFITDTVFKYVK